MNLRHAISIAALVGLLSVSRADPVDLDNGLVAHLAFDGNTTDVTGHGNDGTIVGGLTWTTDRFGNANSALKFDRNGYVQLNTSLLLNGATTGAITGWVINKMNPGEGGFVVGAGDSREGRDPFTVKFDGGQFAESIFTDTTRDPHAPDRNIGIEGGLGGSLSQDKWISFVAQFSSIGGMSLYQLYLDGVLARQTTYDYSISVQYDQPMPVQIGALTGFGDTQFRGTIDDVRLYDRTLNRNEIALLNAGKKTHSVSEGGSVAALFGAAMVGLATLARRRITSRS